MTLTCLGRRVNALDTVVFWKFNGQEIKESTHNIAVDKFLPKRKGTFSLHITNVSEKDVGKYTCIALVANFGKADRVEDIIDLKLYESGKCQTFSTTLKELCHDILSHVVKSAESPSKLKKASK